MLRSEFRDLGRSCSARCRQRHTCSDMRQWWLDTTEREKMFNNTTRDSLSRA